MENIFIVLCILFGISCTVQDSLDDVISGIFDEKYQAKEANTFCGHNKKCIPRYLCSNDSSVVTDGKGIISIRDKGVECPYLEVCCDIAHQVEKPIINAVPDEQHSGCGYRNPEGVGFRISESVSESQFGEFPWVVAILQEVVISKQQFSVYVCGGAIIAPNVVITAAHCIGNHTADALTVRAGEWDSQTTSEILPHIDRRVKKIIKHEHFNRHNLFNDIVILILEDHFPWQENIRPICLPNSNDLNIDTEYCYATGWGKDKFGKSGVYQSILKKVDLPLLSNQKCQADFRKTRLGPYFILDRSFICAGGVRGKDTCTGDGGSPLVCRISGFKDRYYLIGLVAWGLGCGEENEPSAYANVNYFIDWLSEKLLQNQIDPSYFTV